MQIFTRPWDLVFFVGFVAYTAIRAVYVRRTKREPRTHRQVDGVEKLLLALVIPGSVLLPVLYLFTPLLSFADYELPDWTPWAGCVLMVAALWLFWRSHEDLGQNWSVTLEMRACHELVTHGVYRRVRHPMYASIFLFSLAQALLLPNWLAGWCAFATFSVMYLVRTPREEAMLAERLGQPYRDYMAKTGRLWPKITKPAASQF